MSKYALILGATSDISRAIAHQCAAKGIHLQLAARNAQRLQADASDLQIRYNIQVQTLEFDALKMEEHADFYAQLNPKPEWVFCVFGLLTEQEEAQQDWHKARQMLDVNFTGAASILHQAANEMEQAKRGVIIGVSSVAGDRGRASNYYYGSAKAGFTALLSGLRNRLSKSNVHVLSVKPGFVETAMTEGMDLPPVITSTPNKVASNIIKAVEKRQNTLYTMWMWRYIMFIIRNIPEAIFKKLSL